MFLPIAAVLALQVWLSMTDRFDSEVARAAAVVPSFLVLCILGGDETVTEQPQLGATYIVSGTLNLVSCGGRIGGVGVIVGGAFSVDDTSNITTWIFSHVL